MTTPSDGPPGAQPDLAREPGDDGDGDGDPVAGDAGEPAAAAGELAPRRRRRRRRHRATGGAEPAAGAESRSQGRPDSGDPAAVDDDRARSEARHTRSDADAGRGDRGGREASRDGAREASRDAGREASRDGAREASRGAREAGRGGGREGRGGGREASRGARDRRRPGVEGGEPASPAGEAAEPPRGIDRARGDGRGRRDADRRRGDGPPAHDPTRAGNEPPDTGRDGRPRDDADRTRGDRAARRGGRGEPREHREPRPPRDPREPSGQDAAVDGDPRSGEPEATSAEGRHGPAVHNLDAATLPAALRGPATSSDDLDADGPAAPAVAWGKDDDGPAADVALAADLPGEPPSDDPDPVTHPLLDLPTATLGDDVVSVVGIRFVPGGRIQWCDAGDADYARGERVVADSERGARLAWIAVPPARRTTRDRGLRRVIRRANEVDLRAERDGDAGRAHALRVAKDRAAALRLPLKVFRVELLGAGGTGRHGQPQIGRGTRLNVYYMTDERLDLREFIRDVSAQLGGARVELRQLGVRDEAKAVGGIGSCGLTLCCTTWLPDFVPVSIKMAKDQGLVLSPTKVSGQCGRLKCCLVYEQAAYAELRKGLPKLGKRVVSARGEGRVVEVDVLRQRIRVSYGPGDTEVVGATEVRPLFPSGNPPARGPDRRPAGDAPGGEPDDGDEADDGDDADDGADSADSADAIAGSELAGLAGLEQASRVDAIGAADSLTGLPVVAISEAASSDSGELPAQLVGSDEGVPPDDDDPSSVT